EGLPEFLETFGRARWHGRETVPQRIDKPAIDNGCDHRGDESPLTPTPLPPQSRGERVAKYLPLAKRTPPTEFPPPRNFPPPLKSRPLVLSAPAERNRIGVVACSAGARRYGVVPGMLLADARALCPPAVQFEPHDPHADHDALRELAHWAGQFSPCVGI